MDACDQAQVEIERQEARILAVRKPTAPVGVVSAADCAECGLGIPSKRQIVIPGCQHCAECATLIERGLL